MNHSACYFSFSVWGLTIYFVALKDNLCSHRTLASYFLLYWVHYSFLFKYLQSQPPLMFLLKYLLNIFYSFGYLHFFQFLSTLWIVIYYYTDPDISIDQKLGIFLASEFFSVITTLFHSCQISPQKWFNSFLFCFYHKKEKF